MFITPQWLHEGWIVAMVLVLGLCFGSFVTLLAYRLPREEPIVRGRSRCPECSTLLGVSALFPLLSWLWQRGKCRYCSTSIHARYPVIELVQALLFLFVYAVHGLSWEALVLALFSVALLVLVVVDFEWYIIPDEVQIAGIILALLYHLAAETEWTMVLGGLAVGLAIGFGLRFGYGWIMRKEGLGWGDVKFLAVSGLWLADTMHWPPFLFYAGVWGVVTAIGWRLAGKGAVFPFGPALAASLFMTLLTPSSALFFWTIGHIYA